MFEIDYDNIDLGPFDFEKYEFDPQQRLAELRANSNPMSIQEFLYKNLKKIDPKSGRVVPYYG